MTLELLILAKGKGACLDGIISDTEVHSVTCAPHEGRSQLYTDPAKVSASAFDLLIKLLNSSVPFKEPISTVHRLKFSINCAELFSWVPLKVGCLQSRGVYYRRPEDILERIGAF